MPRKNSRMLGDIPLLGWTAEAVKNPAYRERLVYLVQTMKKLLILVNQLGWMCHL